MVRTAEDAHTLKKVVLSQFDTTRPCDRNASHSRRASQAQRPREPRTVGEPGDRSEINRHTDPTRVRRARNHRRMIATTPPEMRTAKPASTMTKPSAKSR